MSTLSNEIQDLIAKNLPAIAANEFQRYLMQAAGFETQNKTLQEEVQAWKKTANARDMELATVKASIADLQAREKRSLALDARERGFELECARLKLAAAEDKTNSIVGLAEIAFRNPRLVHSMTENAQVQRPQGNPPYMAQMLESKTISSTTAETK